MSLLVGCGPIVNSADDHGDGSGGDSGGSDGTLTGGADDGASGADDTGGPVCGDGIVDGDEACDDGNADNGDGCNVDCRASGAPLWTAVVDHGPGERTYATRVAVSPLGGVFAGVSHYDAEGHGGAELWALDLAGVVGWTAVWSVGAEIEQVYGLVASSAGDPSMLTSSINQTSYTTFVQTYAGADGALGSGVVLGVGAQTYAVGSTIDGLDTVISLGIDGDTDTPWIEGTDQNGSTRWVAQPSAPVGTVAGLAVGGAYVLYADVAPNGEFALERLDADGAVLWSTTTPCSGVLAVAGDDDVTVVSYADEGVQLCRVNADGALLGTSRLATGAHAIAAAGTDGADVIIGGYTEDGAGQVSPWIGRISGDDEVLWTHAPEVASPSAFVQTIAADEGVGIVVAGMSETTDEPYGYLVALTP